MNNFNGILEEYANVAVDCFDGESLKATAFFLSHCHTDHMRGLSNSSFCERLKFCSNIKLYCSRITSDLLVGDARFKHLEPFMMVLEVQEPITLNVPGHNPSDETTQVLVTFLPAGHCPGSIMVLFEGYGGTVLYTGDFRLTKEDLQKMDGVFKDGDRIKRLDKLYIDTTFCTHDAMKLPLRRQSRDALFDILDPWLSEASNHVVCLSCPAQFGCEYLFVELNKRYNMKVHVWQKKMWKYKAIPEILESVTLNRMSTRLHACGYKLPKSAADDKESPDYGHWLPCERYEKRKRRNILFVRFSTMWFTSHNNSSDGLVHSYSDNSYRICYSMHSSCEEICKFVQHFKPKSLHPLVIPLGSTLENVHQILKLDPEQLSSLESLTENKFGSLKNETLLTSGSGSTESDLVFQSDSQLTSPELKRLKTAITSHPQEIQETTRLWRNEGHSPSRSNRQSGFQEFDFSPTKTKVSQSESCPSSHADVPKWTFEISPCKELSSSQATSCSVALGLKVNSRMQTSSSWTFEDSPSKESNSSVPSSQESHGSGYKSIGVFSEGLIDEPTIPQSTNFKQTPVGDVLSETSQKSHASMDFIPHLEPKKQPAENILLELSSSSVEVIDLTEEVEEATRETKDDVDDWDSTPELDDILILE